MNTGSVYYFNATPSQLVLINNGFMLNAGIPGVQPTSGYVPVGNEAPRSPGSVSGSSAFGTTNSLVAMLPDGSGRSYVVTIDPQQIPIFDDLQLYVYVNELVLVSPDGMATSIDGTLVPPDQVAVIKA